ncbi:6-phosphogluconolactonase [Aquabacterium fontiphilum]|uniref:6-phosphogluconolactonase n=1 Tax=Aquabacterium fontiphilum TaxID=450365 RepID=UPI00137818D0|nr:6-phosphogluconolactonase [Aquabacterium fontiphilum]NBD21835.1 6-phosphogluconolactonase [Aquabacterium fontiphilum]
MSTRELGQLISHTATDPARLAQDLADFVAARLREGLAARGTALLVVSGGSTPVPFFQALSQVALDWSRVTVTLADERWLPHDHADSNAGLVRRHLLQGPAASARWVPLGQGRGDPALAWPAVEAALAQAPWPADVVVLGMGADGHTASLFPGAPGLAEALDAGCTHRCQVVPAPAPPNVPVDRITLTARALLDARTLVLHTTGAAKRALVAQAMDGLGSAGGAGAAGSGADLAAVMACPVRLVLWQTGVPCHLFHAD